MMSDTHTQKGATVAAIAFVKHSASTFVDGKRIRLVKDEAWDAADPVVKARPDLFSGLPERLQSSVEKPARPRAVAAVEAASAAPGEKRSVRKPKN